MSMTKPESYTLFDIPIYFKDKFVNSIDMSYVIDQLEERLPAQFFYGIDTIFVGEFEDFKDKNTNAKLQDGAIYVSNEQDDEEDMVDDIAHEVAHNVENLHGSTIYGDDAVEVEFLGKRKRLFQLLKAEYGSVVDSWAPAFLRPDYSERFDELLYKVIGYPSLTSISMGLFTSPYGITSLREYFATAFEEYFLKDSTHVNNVSPSVHQKIEKILDPDSEETHETYS